MSWGYKAHRILSCPLNALTDLCEFFSILSWQYAHYRNGRGPRGPVKDSFLSEVRFAWRYRHRE